MDWIEINPIWVVKNKFEICKGELVITNRKRYDELLAELRNLDTFVRTEKECREGTIEEDFTQYTSDGAIDYNVKDIDCPRSNGYDGHHFVVTYKNPRAALLNLLTGRLEDGNLLQLFGTLERGNSKEKQLEELKNAKRIIEELKQRSLSGQTFDEIIKRMWPSFGTYALEGMKCTKYVTKEKYSLIELQEIAQKIERFRINASPMLMDILKQEEIAQINEEIFSLTRKFVE